MPAGKTQHPVIRRLAVDDIDQLMSIEQLAYPHPWTRGIFEDCLRVGYACFGLQFGRELGGYTIFNWAAGEAHLLNLCIQPRSQGQGYGGILLDYTVAQVSRMDNESMFLEVRESNPAAVSLYQHKGFEIVGNRPDYYRADCGREDAIVMRLALTS